jgi:hypothetical protein
MNTDTKSDEGTNWGARSAIVPFASLSVFIPAAICVHLWFLPDYDG